MTGEWIEAPLPEVIDFREGPGILAKEFRDEGTPLVRLSGLDRRRTSPRARKSSYFPSTPVTGWTRPAGLPCIRPFRSPTSTWLPDASSTPKRFSRSCGRFEAPPGSLHGDGARARKTGEGVVARESAPHRRLCYGARRSAAYRCQRTFDDRGVIVRALWGARRQRVPRFGR